MYVSDWTASECCTWDNHPTDHRRVCCQMTTKSPEKCMKHRIRPHERQDHSRSHWLFGACSVVRLKILSLSSAINSLELSISSISPLCPSQQDAEWILEDAPKIARISTFGTIVFTDFSETKANGTTDNLQCTAVILSRTALIWLHPHSAMVASLSNGWQWLEEYITGALLIFMKICILPGEVFSYLLTCPMGTILLNINTPVMPRTSFFRQSSVTMGSADWPSAETLLAVSPSF